MYSSRNLNWKDRTAIEALSRMFMVVGALGQIKGIKVVLVVKVKNGHKQE